MLTLSALPTTASSASDAPAGRSLMSFSGDEHFDFSTCSAAQGNCIRLGVFYCASATATASVTIEAPSCLRIRGYNMLLDWYRQHVNATMRGRIASVPVQFVNVTLPPYSPTSTELARLINSSFWENSDGTGRALIDFVVLPPGAAWWEVAMMRFEKERIPAIAAHAPLASLYQCALVPTITVSSGSTADSAVARASVPASSNVDAQNPACIGRSGARRFEYLHGISNTADQFLTGWVNLLALRKATSMAIVVASDVAADAHPLGLAAPRGFRARMLQPMRVGLQQAAKENHINVLDVSVVSLLVTPGSTTANASSLASDRATISRIVRHWKNLHPQAVALITLDCSPWIQALREQDFAPDSVAATFCIREGDYVLDSDVASAWTREDALFSPAAALAVSDSADGGSILFSRGASSSDTLYMVDSAQWSSQMSGSAYTENAMFQEWALFPHAIATNSSVQRTNPLSSPKMFEVAWKQVLGLPLDSTAVPSAEEAAVLAAFSMLQGAITLSNQTGSSLFAASSTEFFASSIAPELVNRQLQLYYENSFYGLLTTNRFGINQQKSVVSMQRSSRGDVSIVAPQSAASMDFIFPMPTWSERVYVRNVLSRYAIGWVVLALLITCCAVTMILAASFEHFRGYTIAAAQHGAANSSSNASLRSHHPNALHVRFFYVVGFGALIGYFTPLVWSVDNNLQMCEARLWLWTIAPHIIVDSLAAASVCMDREVRRHAHASITVLSKPPRSLSQRIAILAVLFALPQLLINIVWHAGTGGMRPSVIRPDLLRASHNYTACVSTDAGDVCMLLTVVYGGLIIAIGMVYAYRMRKWMRHHSSQGLFQDAQSISLSLALFALTATVVVAVQAALAVRRADPSSQAVLFGLRSIGILIAYQGCFTLLILRRLMDGFALANASSRKQSVRVPQPNAVQQRNASDNHRVGLASNALKSRVSHAPGGGGNTPLPAGSVHPISNLQQSRPDMGEGGGGGGGGGPYPNVFSRGDVHSGPTSMVYQAQGIELAPMMNGRSAHASAAAGGGMGGSARSGLNGHLAVPGAAGRLGSISVIAESPSPRAGDESTSPRPDHLHNRIASPTFPITPMSPEELTARGGAAGETPRMQHTAVASAFLPSFCVLPDSTRTASLSSESFRVWREQLSQHAAELEHFVAVKEAEQHALRDRSTDHGGSYASNGYSGFNRPSSASSRAHPATAPHHHHVLSADSASGGGGYPLESLAAALAAQHPDDHHQAVMSPTSTMGIESTLSPRQLHLATSGTTNRSQLQQQQQQQQPHPPRPRSRHSRRSSSVGDEQLLLASTASPPHASTAAVAPATGGSSSSRPQSARGGTDQPPAVVVVHAARQQNSNNNNAESSPLLQQQTDDDPPPAESKWKIM